MTKSNMKWYLTGKLEVWEQILLERGSKMHYKELDAFELEIYNLKKLLKETKNERRK